VDLPFLSIPVFWRRRQSLLFSPVLRPVTGLSAFEGRSASALLRSMFLSIARWRKFFLPPTRFASPVAESPEPLVRDSSLPGVGFRGTGLGSKGFFTYLLPLSRRGGGRAVCGGV
jgi:hypothetical protein